MRSILSALEEVAVNELGLGFGEASDDEGGAGGGDGEGYAMGEAGEGGAAKSHYFDIGVFDVVDHFGKCTVVDDQIVFFESYLALTHLVESLHY